VEVSRLPFQLLVCGEIFAAARKILRRPRHGAGFDFIRPE
jgi:hypothetical protein